MSDFTNCDMCGYPIHNNKCSCGTWIRSGENKDSSIKRSLEEFHEMKRFALSADIPNLGCAMVLFRGDYKDCMKVQEFIYKLKGRPYYIEDK